ncbi:MAG TPA: hypothetical protein PLO89_08710 [Spirochaetota bacterium]|nr:hypothetical protein [Spirochaetota bacterium]
MKKNYSMPSKILKDYRLFLYLLIFLDLLFIRYNLITNNFELNLNLSKKSLIITSIADECPVFIQKKSNLFENSTQRKRSNQDIDYFISQNIQIYSKILKTIKIFSFKFIYTYKIPYKLFSRPPPGIFFTSNRRF